MNSACMSVHMNMYMCPGAGLHVSGNVSLEEMHACVHICFKTETHVYMYTYIHMYIHS